MPRCLKWRWLPVAFAPLPKGAMVAGGNRLSPTEAAAEIGFCASKTRGDIAVAEFTQKPK